MSFDLSDLVQLSDSLLRHKTNQDKLDLQEKINQKNNETVLMINEQQNELTLKLEHDKLNLGIQETTLQNQKKEINTVKNKLSGWDLSWEDHLELPNDFRSPGGEAVIDEHTKRFKGNLFETFQAGNDTIDMMENMSESISYNNEVLEALNRMEQKYVRGQDFSRNVKTDLLIKGIKDGVDLSSTIQEFQSEFIADKHMLDMPKEEWEKTYPNLVKMGIQYDENMTTEKINAEWSDWEFITDQVVKKDEQGLPYVVTRGPEASDWLVSPEWRGLMDQLAEETKLTPGAGVDWDTNIGLYIKDRISKNLVDRSRLQSQSTSVKDLQKAIGNRDTFILEGLGSYMHSMLKSIDNKLGTAADPSVHKDVYNVAKGVVKDWNLIDDDWASEATIPKMKNELEYAILELIREGADGWDITPDAIKDMIKDKDVKSLAYVFMYGALPGQIDGQFGGPGAPFNYYRSTYSAKDNPKQLLNEKGGLFAQIDYGKITNPPDNDGNTFYPGQWLGGKKTVNYPEVGGKPYTQSQFYGEALDYSWGWGSDTQEQKVLRGLIEAWEVMHDMEFSKLLGEGKYGGGGYFDFGYNPNRPATNLQGNVMTNIYQEKPTPESYETMKSYGMPDWLEPRASTLQNQIAALEAAKLNPDYDPTKLADIDKTLEMLESYQGIYER